MDFIVKKVEVFCSGLADRLAVGNRLRMLAVIALTAWCLGWPMLLAVSAALEPAMVGLEGLIRISLLVGLIMAVPVLFPLYGLFNVRDWSLVAGLVLLGLAATAGGLTAGLLIVVADRFGIGGGLLALAVGGLFLRFYLSLLRLGQPEPEAAALARQF